jgi:hypothetical protein
MAVTYELDPKRSLIRTRCHGEVVFAEVLEHFKTLEADPACPDRLDVLLDLSTVVNLPTPAQVKAIASETSRLLSRVRWGHCAIVAPRDVVYGVSRMFEMVSEPYFRGLRVFRTFDEAEAWLEAPT